MNREWYEIDNADEIDSPSLLIYSARVVENIRSMKSIMPDLTRLRPHVKTNKSPEVSALLLKEGITKFKCATIAEAEMLAASGAPDVLLAYQPVGPKATRFVRLTKMFPATSFSCLVDNREAGLALSQAAKIEGTKLAVYVDLNVGMNRTGIIPGEAEKLFMVLHEMPGLKVKGLHAYDGHIRDQEISLRTENSNRAFEPVAALREKLELKYGGLRVIAGGTPTFPVHAKRADIECSPGTFIFWDYGYDQLLTDEPFVFAAAVMTRVISKPTSDILCVDLGHKNIASENSIDQRVFFLNAKGLVPIGHSEEHMVFRVEDGSKFFVGQVLYGVPFHICPTCALYDSAWVIEGGKAVGQWSIDARKRTISV